MKRITLSKNVNHENNIDELLRKYLPTNARMTVSKGAAGNDIFVLNSNICRSSTMNTNI